MDGTTAGSAPGRVVVGVDGSPSARTAVMWAASEAALRGSTLFLVHAADTDVQTPFLSRAEIVRSRRAGRELLDRTAEAITARDPELAVVTELTDGGAADGLRGAAALTGTIVVGHRGLGGFPSLLLGSVGLQVAAGATTPVVVVRGTAEPVEAGVVLAAVRDEADVGCARAGAREALLRKVPLRLLHIWSAGLSARPRAALPHGGDEDARGHLRVPSSLSDRVREEFPGLTVHADGQLGRNVPGALVDASHHADLLVVGGRRSPGHLGPTLGRTTLSLLQHAHCPVELIPRQGPGHGSAS
ncbi:universal stress protein [Streptomyces sp. NBC_00691]|uniref:universal stress protein n=1 Tax=Streptomyces sp. NBC_00691 TaxID=2903671 RepID=UPI002E311934|nr:universal stress protein [Streptomyces sp. NBC_00691]